MSKLLTGVFMTGLILVCQVSASHALDLFMLIPGIPGELTLSPHTGWIDVQSIAWGHGEAPPGSPTKIQFGRVNITKRLDSTSAALALHAVTGQPITEVKFELTRTVSATLQVLFRMKLTNVRVASYAASVESASAFPSDQIALSFNTITWITFKLNAQGAPVAGSSACFDVVKNTLCAVAF